jgi:hypothetical protein
MYTLGQIFLYTTIESLISKFNFLFSLFCQPAFYFVSGMYFDFRRFLFTFFHIAAASVFITATIFAAIQVYAFGILVLKSFTLPQVGGGI